MIAKTIVLGMFLASLLVPVLSTPRPSVIAAEEQALIATIRLRSGDMGSPEERRRIAALEDQLSEAIKHTGAGELDGEEYGVGVCTIYMYGPSAERLLTVALPILKKFRPPAGSYVTKRYGKPGAKQDRIALNDK